MHPKLIFILSVLIIAIPTTIAVAEEGASAHDNKAALAEKMHEYRPVRDQVNAAIDRVAQGYPPAEREAFKAAMRRVLNYKTVERISIDAMVETYSEEELKAMVEYYAKPEARSASEKYKDYASKVHPELVRLIDQAMMRVKTGGN